jgi:hypothetical protein
MKVFSLFPPYSVLKFPKVHVFLDRGIGVANCNKVHLNHICFSRLMICKFLYQSIFLTFDRMLIKLNSRRINASFNPPNYLHVITTFTKCLVRAIATPFEQVVNASSPTTKKIIRSFTFVHHIPSLFNTALHSRHQEKERLQSC